MDAPRALTCSPLRRRLAPAPKDSRAARNFLFSLDQTSANPRSADLWPALSVRQWSFLVDQRCGTGLVVVSERLEPPSHDMGGSWPRAAGRDRQLSNKL